MLYQIVYASAALRLWPDEELATLLRKSRENNARDGITGMLLYQGGNFIQAVEGPEDAVKALEERIQKDPRHRGVIVLIEGPIEERQFPEWTMGFQHMDRVIAGGETGQNAAWAPGSTPEDLAAEPGRALILLKSFRRSLR